MRFAGLFATAGKSDRATKFRRSGRQLGPPRPVSPISTVVLVVRQNAHQVVCVPGGDPFLGEALCKVAGDRRAVHRSGVLHGIYLRLRAPRTEWKTVRTGFALRFVVGRHLGDDP